MISTRERNEAKVRYDVPNDYVPMYGNDCYSESAYDSSVAYPTDKRIPEDYDYARGYENIDFNSNQYDCATTENTFRPIELSDIDMNVKTEKAKSKLKLNMSVKTKLMVGVYFALVTLIIVMLLVNAFPVVKAQGTQPENTPKEVVNQDNYQQESSNIAGQSGLVKGDGYTYDTQTNWFDKMCDSISGIFN